MLAGEAPGSEPMSRIASIAVLPFTDLSQAHDHDWFCDGLAEEILDSLVCVRGLRVASRGASFQFRGGNVDPRAIGEKLNVDAVLEGSVRVAGPAPARDRATGRRAQRLPVLVGDLRARGRRRVRHPARDRRERRARAQAEPARERRFPRRQVRAAQHGGLRALPCAGASSPGQFSQHTIMQAPQQFRRAIELDPQYAQAYAGLADALAQQAQWRFAPAAQVMAEGTVAANRALDLAPEMAEAHMAQGPPALGRPATPRARAAPSSARSSSIRRCSTPGTTTRATATRAANTRAPPSCSSARTACARTISRRWYSPPAPCTRSATRPARARWPSAPPTACCGSASWSRTTCARITWPRACCCRSGRGEEGRRLSEHTVKMAPGRLQRAVQRRLLPQPGRRTDKALDLLERALARGGGFPTGYATTPTSTRSASIPRFQALLARIRDTQATAG
jgi:hypothetical protein